MDFKLELVLIPVTDVDRAKDFYVEKAGFKLDVDHQPSDEFRVVQMTPPGSACSITIGIGITDATPGSVRGTHLVVTDIEAARAELVERGVEVSDVRHMTPDGWKPGPDPEHRDYNSFADFSDPDGNTWVLQESRRYESGWRRGGFVSRLILSTAMTVDGVTTVGDGTSARGSTTARAATSSSAQRHGDGATKALRVLARPDGEWADQLTRCRSSSRRAASSAMERRGSRAMPSTGSRAEGSTRGSGSIGCGDSRATLERGIIDELRFGLPAMWGSVERPLEGSRAHWICPDEDVRLGCHALRYRPAYRWPRARRSRSADSMRPGSSSTSTARGRTGRLRRRRCFGQLHGAVLQAEGREVFEASRTRRSRAAGSCWPPSPTVSWSARCRSSSRCRRTSRTEPRSRSCSSTARHAGAASRSCSWSTPRRRLGRRGGRCSCSIP